MVKKVKLIFPPSDKRYARRVTGYSTRPSPPQTAHAVLGAWLKKHSRKKVFVEALNDQKPVNERFEERSTDEFMDFAKDADIVGITAWYHNIETALDLAKKIKEENGDALVVLGGPGVSNARIAGIIFNNHKYIDFVVQGDGESALLSLVEGREFQTKITNLSEMPLWDFTDTLDYEALLEPHKDLKENEQSMVGIFSNRGCPKANRSGPCIFCSSNVGGRGLRILPPEIFWQQRKRLYEIHGIRDVYCSDNVFPLSLGYIERVAAAQDANHNLRMRVYAYPSDIQKKGGLELGRKLSDIGVYNVLFGIESFDRRVSKKANKTPFQEREVSETIQILRNAGIGTTISMIFGLPGESTESNAINECAFAELMRKYGNNGIQRVYLSLGMPLIGTAWYDTLAGDERIVEEYNERTGENLAGEVSPRYDVLRELSIKYYSKLNGSIYSAIDKLLKIAREYLPQENIGGYGLEEVNKANMAETHQ
jgi:radical SAM superfamily enzyme YgiQ (UPF0313 family)